MGERETGKSLNKDFQLGEVKEGLNPGKRNGVPSAFLGVGGVIAGSIEGKKGSWEKRRVGGKGVLRTGGRFLYPYAKGKVFL